MRHAHSHRHGPRRQTEHVAALEATDSAPWIGRREFLLAGSVLGTGVLAGCSGGESKDGGSLDPVSLAESRECDVCGMVISEHPGPNGQIYYRENSPETHDNPAWFDSPKACLFPYYFERQQRDWTAEVVYVTDYSTVDYEISDVEGQQYIQTATGPETFSDAADVVFVIGSEVHGAMGPDFIPFSEASDGSAFADEYGGETVTMEEITPETLAR